MAILNNNPLVGASGNQGGYNIKNSLRFRSSATAYLNRTPGSSSNATTWTWSGWVKRGALGTTQPIFGAFVGTGNRYNYFRFDAADTLNIYSGVYTTGASTTDLYSYVTTQVFRDPSAWYHIVYAVDTTQATSTNRVLLYINGVQVTSFSTATAPTQNGAGFINQTVAHNMGGAPAPFGFWFDGYITEQNFIDGQQLTPSSFGETDSTTGVWKPKAYTGTYGTNGFYLKFSDIATTSGSNAGLGKDFSGNSNYWTTNNISVTSGTTYDAMTDSPTLTSATVANYCVWNPLRKPNTGSYSNGNLTIVGGTDTEAFGTMAYPSTGSFYFEYLVASTGGGGFGPQVGICSLDGNYTVKYFRNGYKGVNGTNTAYGGAWALNDIIGIAYNASTNTVTFYKNNVSQGDITASSGQEYFPYFFDNSSSTHNFTFGQRPFSYTPPTGYVALNTYNLPDSTIKKGNSYMDATLYSGNSTTVTATNAGAFKPDLVWIKDRTSIAQHVLTDSVRGTSAQLFSSLTNAEQSNSTYVTSFNSNGFTVGVGNSGTGVVNNTGDNFVGWQWQAGQGSTSSNTSGSITSTVSVNATAGFSIVTYTGTGANATVGHGLGVAPKMIVTFVRNTAGLNHVTYHASLGNTQSVWLNLTNAATTDGAWNNTTPTSTVFSVAGSSANVNGNGYTIVAYCWAAISGFSAFGSYTGNGSTDGPFVYLGFRPKYVMVKRTDVANDWQIYDTSRNPSNVANLTLAANLSDAEYTRTTTDLFDLTSNGFKIRASNNAVNASGGTYIYIAFAENPFKNSLAR